MFFVYLAAFVAFIFVTLRVRDRLVDILGAPVFCYLMSIPFFIVAVIVGGQTGFVAETSVFAGASGATAAGQFAAAFCLLGLFSVVVGGYHELKERGMLPSLG